jgi:hypothetical protein
MSADGGDYLVTTFAPTTAQTYAACFNCSTKSKTVFGTNVANAGYGFRINSSGQMTGAVNGTGAATAGDVSSTNLVALVRYSGGSFDFYVNGAKVGSSTYTGLTTANPWTLCGNATSPGEFMTGNFYRAMVIARSLTDTEVPLAMRALGSGVVSF